MLWTRPAVLLKHIHTSSVFVFFNIHILVQFYLSAKYAEMLHPGAESTL